MRIPEEIIARVRDALDIADVVAEVAPIKKSGAYFFGLCPFHTEKSPSFSVQPARGRYHCFGCGADGDVIDFVRETRGLDFLEAVQALAQRAGIKLPETQDISAQERVRMQRLAAMRSVLSEVQSEYHQSLVSRMEKSASHPASETDDPVVAYCRKRGLTLDVVRRFGLGWAQSGIAASLLKGRESIGVDAGILYERDGDDHKTSSRQGRWRDRLRDRLTFPIADDQGRVIAFGGRVIAQTSDAPKYLNTPETELYKKGESLYRIHDARASIHKHRRAIVVEGYMDALSLACAGIDEVVACCGTAMTEHHLKKLLKWADVIVMLFDGDQAGAKASSKAAKMCLSYFQAGKHFRFAQIPGGQDPDALVRTEGPRALRALIEESPELSDYLLCSTAHKHRSLRSIEDKSAFLQDIRTQVKEAGLPENTFTALLIKQAYRMAHGNGPVDALGSGARWRGRWRSVGASVTSLAAGPNDPLTGGARSARPGPSAALGSFGASSLWDRMLHAIEKAPVMAGLMAGQLAPLLDMNEMTEAKVAVALIDCQKTQASTHPGKTDDGLSADFLASSSRLISKKRRDDAIEELGHLCAQGQITEAEYLTSTMKILSVF